MGSLMSRCKRICTCEDCKQGSFKNDPPFSEILAEQENLQDAPKQYSWDKRPKLNPADYIISDLHGGEQRVKRPGSINGQQFIIRNCSNSNIYLFDYSSQITIDDCSDCLFVLGPVQGSVFLRDTKSSTLVCSSSQLRLRDCQNIHLYVGTESDPIIESSYGVIVAPYFLSYKGIKDHFASAKLNRFKATRWSDIYDFTPNDVTPNWKHFDGARHSPQKYICPPQPSEDFSDLEISVADKLNSFVPVTHPFASLELEGAWRKQEVVFTQEPGQELVLLEQLMDKFHHEKFLQGQSTILCDISTNSNQYVFTYFQKQC